jgi:23S rRNA pseudouridine1911/1915/1917 synthase
MVSPELSGKRLDQALALLFPDYSRSRLQGWIREGRVHVDGVQRKPKEKVWPGEKIVLRAVLDSVDSCQPEDIPLDLLYEDEHLLVVNKPAGLVVHPAAGNWSGTLQNALLHHDSALASLPRGGIVHRLDKDTTGLLVVARNLRTHKSLVELLQAREIKREYMAIVNGLPTAGGMVDAPIGRHPVNRVRMAVVASGKPARTHYRINERFRRHSLLDVQLESGRTHQIRVHMAYIHHPLLGDPVYGGRLKLPSGASDETVKMLRGFGRQALHARRLSLTHPVSGQAMTWESPLPVDFSTLLEGLRQDREEHGA